MKKFFRKSMSQSSKAEKASIASSSSYLGSTTGSYTFVPSPSNTITPTESAHGAATDTAAVFRRSAEDRMSTEDYIGAVTMYTEALKYNPNDYEILIGRAIAHLFQAQYDHALADTNAAIQKNSTNWYPWKTKGDIQSSKGDLQGAEESYQAALGFSQGLDRSQIQRALTDIRLRRRQQGGSSPVPPPAQTVPSPSFQQPQTQPQPQAFTQQTSPTANTYLYPSYATPQAQNSTPAANSPSPAVPPPQIYQPQPSSSPIPQTTAATNLTPNVQSGNLLGTSTTSAPQIPQVEKSVPFTATDIDKLTQDTSSLSIQPATSPATIQNLDEKLNIIEQSLSTRNKGKASVRAYNDAQKLDMVRLIYFGMTQDQLTQRELGTPSYLHPSHSRMAVSNARYPGSTFLDMDLETGSFYDGKVTGTVTVSGYSEEYRNQQLAINPQTTLSLEANVNLPVIDLDRIITRLQFLQTAQYSEDSEGLKPYLGLDESNTNAFGFGTGCNTATNRQKRIDSLCMLVNRTSFAEPDRFPDLSRTRTFTNRLLSVRSTGSEVMLRDFLYQILIGAEILIRLKLQPPATTYTHLITDKITTMIVLADLFMSNVQITPIQNPLANVTVDPGQAPPAVPRYSFYACIHQQQVEGLLRFAETMAWPYLDEARTTIENSYPALAAGTADMSWDVCDWLFGFSLPGKIFRHRIMAVLIDVSISVRSLNASPYFENGLIVKNKSYWPKRTVLGRVLGGLKNPKSACGWVGPVPAPKLLPPPTPRAGQAALAQPRFTPDITGWIRLSTRIINLPVPILKSDAPLQQYGFSQLGSEKREDIVDAIVDINEYIIPNSPTPPAPNSVRPTFKGINLELMPTPHVTVDDTSPGLPKETYRASLDFDFAGEQVRYTLFSNPIFIEAPPCIGSHPMFRRQAQLHLSNVVSVTDLKETHPEKDVLLIINALGDGDEVVARAWCAETGRHAVVRREVAGRECCFTCAVEMASGPTGLAVNCVIWSR